MQSDSLEKYLGLIIQKETLSLLISYKTSTHLSYLDFTLCKILYPTERQIQTLYP
jgi:hypothetical protein